MFEIYEICEENKDNVRDIIVNNWGSAIMVTCGRIHKVEELTGFLLFQDNKIIGLVTYRIDEDSYEIVSLDSLVENIGVGSRLIEKVIEVAKDNNCKRVWLITTNDNMRALKFYQKRGFDIKELYLNSIEKSRKIKPEIPMVGYDDIPILHEIKLEKLL